MTSCNKETNLNARISELAREAGFDVVRVTVPSAISGQVGERLDEFVELNRHGDMDWMATTMERRRHPCAMWPEARAIIMLGFNYGPSRDPLEALQRKSNGVVACYAKGKDYHVVIKKKLKRVAGAFYRETGEDVKVFVDTAPLMEKPAAAASGLGWQGKHTNLVSREFGSWLFIGAILTTAELQPDEPEIDHCGTCTRCLDICPTKAFPAPYQLDARRCISYLTIEHKGTIARELRAGMGNHIFGCDDCLAVCPWNKYAQVAREARFHARPQTDDPPLGELLELDDEAFRVRFAGTPIKRTGRDRFLRNVLIAAGNSGDRLLLPQVEALLGGGSALVRAMAVWAAKQLLERGAFAILRGRIRGTEQDSNVLAEWDSIDDQGGVV